MKIGRKNRYFMLIVSWTPTELTFSPEIQRALRFILVEDPKDGKNYLQNSTPTNEMA
jgi:hypothetical protein